MDGSQLYRRFQKESMVWRVKWCLRSDSLFLAQRMWSAWKSVLVKGSWLHICAVVFFVFSDFCLNSYTCFFFFVSSSIIVLFIVSSYFFSHRGVLFSNIHMRHSWLLEEGNTNQCYLIINSDVISWAMYSCLRSTLAHLRSISSQVAQSWSFCT